MDAPPRSREYTHRMHIHPSRSHELATCVNLLLARAAHRPSAADRGDEPVTHRDLACTSGPGDQSLGAASVARAERDELDGIVRTMVSECAAAVHDEGVADHEVVLVLGTHQGERPATQQSTRYAQKTQPRDGVTARTC
jgi:hypothetical protein